MRWIAAVLAAAAALIMVGGRAAADSLASQLDNLVSTKGFQRTDPIVPTLVRTVARSADFPTAATGPDFAYEYRPDTGGFERSTRPLNPVLVEAAQTIGRNALQIGVSMLWSGLNRQNGGLLSNTRAGFEFRGSTSEGPVRIPGTLTFDEFRIEDFVFSGLVSYGITDRWDVGLVVPGVLTSLQAQGRSTAHVVGQNLTLTLDRFDIDDSKLGLGDILLRTKYALDPVWGIAVAPTLVLRLPTGNPNDFQGLGDTTLTPGIAATRSGERLGFYADAGFEFNADDLSRSAFRYGMALSVRMLESASIVAELTGKSTVTDDTFSVPVAGTTRQLPASVPRSDIVSGAVSVKARLLPRSVAYVSVLFPLTKDGVTAPVTPIGGVEIHF